MTERIRPSLRDLSRDYDEPAFPADARGDASSSAVPAATVSRAKPPPILSTSTSTNPTPVVPSPAQPASAKPKSRFALEREQQRARAAAERFELRLDGEDDVPPATFLSSLVRDVVERESGVAAAPSFEQQTGFPASDQLPPVPYLPATAIPTVRSIALDDASPDELASLLAAVSHENDGVLAGMTDAEILEEQRNIRESMGLSEGVIRMLEQRTMKKVAPPPAAARRRPDVAPTAAHPAPPRPRAAAVEEEEEGSPEYIRKHFFPDEPRNANLDWMRAGPPTTPSTSGRTVPSFDLSGAPLELSAAHADQPSSSEHHVSSASSFTVASLAALAASAVPSQRSTALLALHRILMRPTSLEALGGETALSALRVESALVAGRAVRDASVGVVTTALSLLAFLLSTEPAISHVRPVHKLEGAEEPPSVLASFLSSEPYAPLGSQVMSLPRPSLDSILAILTAVLHLSTVSPAAVLTPLLSTPNLLEGLSRRLIAVPWPPSPSSPPPAPAALAFLTLLAQSSRAAAKHLWAHKLVEPSLRFLAVLPSELEPHSPLAPLAKDLVLETLRLWETMARYGLGTSLRTQGADLVDAVLRASADDDQTAQAALSLLAVWTTAAIDPHTTGHDIIWSQVQDWGELAIGYHRTLLDAGGLRRTGLLSSAWALLAEWMEGSKVNKSWRGEQERKWLGEQLGDDFATGGKALAAVHQALERLVTGATVVDQDAVLVETAVRLSSAYEEPTTPATPALLHLAPDAVDTALGGLLSAPPSPVVRALLVALLPFLPSTSSRLARTLEVLVVLRAGDEVAARDLTAWVLATASAELDPAHDLASLANASKLQHFVTYAIIASAGGRVVGPLRPAVKDLKLTASQRPFASDVPLLARNWPLSVLDELLRSSTSPAFEKLPSEWDDSELELVRTALATMRVVQSNAPFEPPVVVYDLIKVFMLEKDNLTSVTPGAEADLFRDDRVQRSMAGLVSPLELGQRPTQVVRRARRPASATLEGVSSLVSSAPFYQLYTDLVGLYDASGVSHALFAQVLLPALATDYPVDYRRLVWIDYTHLVRTIHLDVPNVATDHALADGDGALSSFLFPAETDAALLAAYADALVSGKIDRDQNPFLYLVAVHHLTATLFATEEQPATTRLAVAVAAKCSSDLLEDLVRYGQVEEEEGEVLVLPPRCYEQALDEAGRRERMARWKKQRRQ